MELNSVGPYQGMMEHIAGDDAKKKDDDLYGQQHGSYRRQRTEEELVDGRQQASLLIDVRRLSNGLAGQDVRSSHDSLPAQPAAGSVRRCLVATADAGSLQTSTKLVSSALNRSAASKKTECPHPS